MLFVLVFGVIVVGHELGHFLLAKANGITVVEFSVAWGPSCSVLKRGEQNIHCVFCPLAAHVCLKGKTGLTMTMELRRRVLFPTPASGPGFPLFLPVPFLTLFWLIFWL
ncbi:MAG: site-2 protease family protein [Eisenbergiella sp.]